MLFNASGMFGGLNGVNTLLDCFDKTFLKVLCGMNPMMRKFMGG